MKPLELATMVRFRTKTDAVTFTDTEMKPIVNLNKDDIAIKIVNENEDQFAMPWFTSLVAGQREYPMPDQVIKVKLVQAQLNGTDWKRLWEFDLNSYRRYYSYAQDDPLDNLPNRGDFSTATTDETTILAAFSDEFPMWDLSRRSIYIYSGSAIIAVTDGLKLRANIYPADITDLTDNSADMSVDPTQTSFGFPKTFHQLLMTKVVIDYKLAKGMKLVGDELAYKQDLAEALDELSGQNFDQEIIASVPADPYY